MLLAAKRNTLPGPQQQLRWALYVRPDGLLLSHNIMLHIYGAEETHMPTGS